MRVFAALPIPQEIKDEIAGIGKLIKARYENIKLVETSNIHLTIHFFGELDDNEVRRLYSVMDDKRLVIERVNASLGNIGFFPPRGNPRVIFVDIENGRESIYRFHGVFEELIRDAEFKVENKPFQTHITIARNKSSRISTEELKLKNAYRKLPFVFDRFVLYQSILHRSGPEYIPLRTVMFS